MAASPDTTSSCGKVRTPRANATGTDPRSAARPRSAQMRTGRRRSRSTQAPATSPNTSVAPEIEPAQQRDLEGARAEDQDRRQRQRDAGDERPEDGDRGRRPDADEGLVAPERGSEGIAHERGAYAPRGRSSRTIGRRRSGRPCGTLRLPRCVRTRAPPGSAVAADPVHLLTESHPDHVRHPQRAAAQDARQPDRPRPDQRGRRRCRHARGPAGPARGRRQLQGRQGLHRPRPRARHRPRGPRQPVGRPAGRQDRQRRARRPPVGG